MRRDRLLFIFACIVLSGLLAFFVLQNNDFTIQDIGRHLMNGKLILQGNTDVLYTNAYSYTMPDQPFINHHWLAGVLFYVVYATGGFRLLSISMTLVMIAALLLGLDAIRRRSTYLIASLVGLPLTLFLAGRHELRPEMFGYFFLSLCLWLCSRLHTQKFFSKKIVLLFCLVQIVWVNLHISFFMELFIIVAYLFGYILKKQYKLAKKFAIFLLLLFACTLFNPNTIRGALEPLSIFHTYGYSIVENQSISFLLPIIADPVVPLYVCVAAICFFSLIATAKKLLIHSVVFSVVGMIMGFKALRNLPLFALLTLPVLAESFMVFLHQIKNKSMNAYLSLKLLLVMCIVLAYLGTTVFIFSGVYQPNINFQHLGANVVPQQFAATEFFKKTHIPGPMFNNYDIGSYLIFALYPSQPVFVDNRPEAYTQDFFQSLYIPMQQQDNVWQKAVQTYGFQSIFFGHRDATPWAISFLRSRLADPEWKAVYLDAYAIIFIRNTSEHAGIIRQYGMDASTVQKNLSWLFH